MKKDHTTVKMVTINFMNILNGETPENYIQMENSNCDYDMIENVLMKLTCEDAGIYKVYMNDHVESQSLDVEYFANICHRLNQQLDGLWYKVAYQKYTHDKEHDPSCNYTSPKDCLLIVLKQYLNGIGPKDCYIAQMSLYEKHVEIKYVSISHQDMCTRAYGTEHDDNRICHRSHLVSQYFSHDRLKELLKQDIYLV